MRKIVFVMLFFCLSTICTQTTAGNYVLDDREVIVTAKDGSGTKINGNLPIGKDEGGTYIQFDGNGNNYIQLEPLPAFDIAKEGLHIVFRAKWEAHNSWSRVFDCGNGADNVNIFIANSSTTSNLAIGLNPGSGRNDLNAYVNGILTLNSLQSWDINISGNKGAGEYNTITAVQSSPSNATYTPQQPKGNALDTIERTVCYIGKSNWSADLPFKGKIYYVLVETGQNHTKLFEFDAGKLSV